MIQKKVKVTSLGKSFDSTFPPYFPNKLPKKNWLSSFTDAFSLHVYTERYVNKGAYHSYRHFSDVTKRFRPLDGEKMFLLPYFLLSDDLLKTYISKPNSFLVRWFKKFSGVPFFVHPDILASYKTKNTKLLLKSKIAGWVTAIPTASTRTLLINFDNQVYMVKVDMSGKRLGRLTRQLPQRSVQRSQIIHDLLQKIPKSEFPQSFAYFPEPMGVGYSDIAGDLGNLYREYEVCPKSKKTRWMLPLFSLYSQDIKNPGNELIIEQLIRYSGLSPLDFFENKVVFPYIYNAFFMAFKKGLMFGPHPQNVLVELDDKFNITRFIYRDLQTVIIDADLRKQLGFVDSFPPEAKIIASWQAGLDRKLEYSCFYDHRMAYQTLEEIILAIAAKYPASIHELQEVVKKVYSKVVELLDINQDEYFPKDGYYLYSDGLMENNIMKPVFFNNPPYR